MTDPSKPKAPLSRRLLVGVLKFVVVPGLVIAGIEGASSWALFLVDYKNFAVALADRQMAHDTLVGWVSKPSQHIPNMFGEGLSQTTNELGMRIHAPVSPALSPGQVRMICSGDSFTFGSGVADSSTWCSLLERHFTGLTTLNMAQRGFGIDQAYLWYARDGSRFPHQVHLFAVIWDDFNRMVNDQFYGVPKPRLKLEGGKLVTANVPVREGTRSDIAWAFRSLTIIPKLRIVQALRRLGPNPAAAAEAKLNREGWPVAERMFQAMRDLDHTRGSELVLVYLPAEVDLQPGSYDRYRKGMTSIAARLDIPVVDLTDDIRRLPRDSVDLVFITANELTYQGASGHYTALGNDWAATAVARHLRQIPRLAPVLHGAEPRSDRGASGNH